MTTEQMKELYATGEWICVVNDAQNSGWAIFQDFKRPELFAFDSTILISKLIHKKHSEVLDHVLNGGEFKCTYQNRSTPNVFEYYADSFMEIYDDSNTYEIIKEEKPYQVVIVARFIDSGQSHYIDADNEVDLLRRTLVFENATRFSCNSEAKLFLDEMRIDNPRFYECTYQYKYINKLLDKPSLNEETSAIGGRVKESYDVCITDEPEPVERITREELKQHIKNCRVTSLGKIQGQYLIFESVANKIIDDLCNKIEYLEANQKEK